VGPGLSKYLLLDDDCVGIGMPCNYVPPSQAAAMTA
jgi:hypothetical protein